jgi:hypothetical protein
MCMRLAIRARNEIPMDEVSIDTIQALLLLVFSFSALGQCRSAYLLLGIAFDVHRVDLFSNK